MIITTLKTIFIIGVLYSASGYAQDRRSDIRLIKESHVQEVKPKNKHWARYTPPYWVYSFTKHIIKPQIEITQRYELPLTQFMKASFKEFGPIKGYFMSIDRINRTGRLGYSDFPRARFNDKNLIIDMPKYYHIR